MEASCTIAGSHNQVDPKFENRGGGERRRDGKGVQGDGAKRKPENSRDGAGNGRTELKVLFANTQSIVNKVNEVRAVVSMLQPEVIAFTETWTNETKSDAFLHIKGYELLIRKDRSDTGGGRGGGIVIYVKEEILAWKEDLTTDFNQLGTIAIKNRNQIFQIHAVYRSPNSA